MYPYENVTTFEFGRRIFLFTFVNYLNHINKILQIHSFFNLSNPGLFRVSSG